MLNYSNCPARALLNCIQSPRSRCSSIPDPYTSFVGNGFIWPLEDLLGHYLANARLLGRSSGSARLGLTAFVNLAPSALALAARAIPVTPA
jgi:hypothetical protein